MDGNQYRWRGGFCLEVNALPNTIVIFGASGDLSGRKLLPALYRLSKRQLLHSRSKILGCARTLMTDEEYRNYLYKKWFSSYPAEEKDEILSFLNRVSYQSGDYNAPAFYQKLYQLEPVLIGLLCLTLFPRFAALVRPDAVEGFGV